MHVQKLAIGLEVCFGTLPSHLSANAGQMAPRRLEIEGAADDYLSKFQKWARREWKDPERFSSNLVCLYKFPFPFQERRACI